MTSIYLLSGSASNTLAQTIAQHSNIPCIQPQIYSFSNGELQITLPPLDNSQNGFILQSLYHPTHDHLMELLFLADVLKKTGTPHITAIIPYLGYARQTHRISILADLLATRIDRIVSLDLHCEHSQTHFPIPFDNLNPTECWINDIKKNHEDPLIIAPDNGALSRANRVANALNGSRALLVNKRNPYHPPTLTQLKHRDCVIVDDIVDSATTLCSVAQILKANGAKSILAYVTHAVLSGTALNALESSELDHVIVSDSIPLNDITKHHTKIRCISIHEILAQKILELSRLGRCVFS